MKYQLFTYQSPSSPRGYKTGIAIDKLLYDLAGIAAHMHLFAIAELTIDEMLKNWEECRVHLNALTQPAAGAAKEFKQWILRAGEVHFCSPITQPGVMYAAGANYRDHVEAMGRAFNMKLVLDPKSEGVAPWHFLKGGRGTLSGHGAAIEFPPHTQKLDWEAELAVVIGKHARKISDEEALGFVAGYTCANDLSARDNLVRPSVDVSSPFRFDWIGHKCFTGACPLGPFLTPAEFVNSPENLDIKLWVNGELRQNSNTSNHLYSVAEQISYLSHKLDLYPGDIILTGTPAGVGMETGTFLKPGDIMEVWIEGLGELKTTVI